MTTATLMDDIRVEEEVFNKAKDNNAVSFSKIADIYYNKKDYSKARVWYCLAVSENNAHSQNRIGWMYQHGEGVHKDYKLAMEWYLKAHENGSILAAVYIGFIYHRGFGVDKDHRIAIRWLLEAANKGNLVAQFNVGYYYENGYGTSINKQYALEWYKKGAEQVHEGAKKAIAKLNKEGFYIDERQKRYLLIEKDIEEHKEKNEELKIKLGMAEQKVIECQNEIRLLKQENDILKLENSVRKKKKKLNPKPDRDNVGQLIEQVFTVIVDCRNSNHVENECLQEDNPNNDSCYDK